MKASERKRGFAWKTKLAKIEQTPPAQVAVNMLDLAIVIRYWQTLLENARVLRYLRKYRPNDLEAIERWLRECARRHSRLQKAACTPLPHATLRR